MWYCVYIHIYILMYVYNINIYYKIFFKQCFIGIANNNNNSKNTILNWAKEIWNRICENYKPFMITRTQSGRRRVADEGIGLELCDLLRVMHPGGIGLELIFSDFQSYTLVRALRTGNTQHGCCHSFRPCLWQMVISDHRTLSCWAQMQFQKASQSYWYSGSHQSLTR